MRHRTGQVTLTVGDTAGQPLAGREVSLSQVRQKFLFGCNIYRLFGLDDPALERAYEDRYCELLNYATLPFYLAHYQPSPEQTHRHELTRMATFCREQGLAAKGHPLVWHETVPEWLTEIPPEDVEPVLWARVRREVTHFAGLIDIWDVVNEAITTATCKPNPVTELCNRIGQVPMIAQAFAMARQANPKARLILNDFNTSSQFETLIERCLEAGVGIDAIGIQSHMHKGYLGPEKMWDICQRFARFGKPLHWTEATILSGPLKTDDDWHSPHPGWDTTPEGEQQQARQVEEFYKLLFGHPAVEAITWWDFSDNGSWQSAPAGLLRADMSPKPAYEVVMDLVRRQWWTGPQRLKTDAQGQVRFSGFLGQYELVAEGKKREVTIDQPGPSAIRVTM